MLEQVAGGGHDSMSGGAVVLGTGTPGRARRPRALRVLDRAAAKDLGQRRASIRVGDHDEMPALIVAPTGGLQGEGETLGEQLGLDRPAQVQPATHRPGRGEHVVVREWPHQWARYLASGGPASGVRRYG